MVLADPWVAAGAATPGRLRLWHTAGVLATLPVAAPEQTGFSFTNLLILAVVIAVFYPVQKKIREVASRRRRERWAARGPRGAGAAGADATRRRAPGGPDCPLLTAAPAAGSAALSPTGAAAGPPRRSSPTATGRR